MKNLFVLGRRFNTHRPFEDMFKKVHIVTSLDYNERDFKDLEKGDVILFEGGEDISPSLYSEPRHAATSASERYSVRDTFESCIFHRFKGTAKFLGICRGAQILCALSGGKLIQDVQNHGCMHVIRTIDNKDVVVSSTHHQMQWPWSTSHLLLAWSRVPRSKSYEGTINGIPMHFPETAFHKEDGHLKEPEVVYYPETQALAMQHHPEFMDRKSQGVEYSRNLVKEYLL